MSIAEIDNLLAHASAHTQRLAVSHTPDTSLRLTAEHVINAHEALTYLNESAQQMRDYMPQPDMDDESQAKRTVVLEGLKECIGNNLLLIRDFDWQDCHDHVRAELNGDFFLLMGRLALVLPHYIEPDIKTKAEMKKDDYNRVLDRGIDEADEQVYMLQAMHLCFMDDFFNVCRQASAAVAERTLKTLEKELTPLIATNHALGPLAHPLMRWRAHMHCQEYDNPRRPVMLGRDAEHQLRH